MSASETEDGPSRVAPPIRVPAVGGTRDVPAADPIATEFILLALRLDQRIPGLVDAYYGPASLKAQVDMEQPRSAARLRDHAFALRDRVNAEVAEPDRRAWLDAQLVALAAQADVLAGTTIAYEDLVTRCMGFAPTRRPDAEFDDARRAIETLLPGPGALSDRLEAWDRGLELPSDGLRPVLGWLIDRFRQQARDLFGLPEGEGLRLSFVTGQPWSAYDWYDGGRRSRIDVRTEPPVLAPDAISLIAHEAYPGHHLDGAWKEAELVDRLGRTEASILLINTPSGPMAEGLAEAGASFAVPAGSEVDLLLEVAERAGLPVAADPAAARATAERAVAIDGPRRRLKAIGGNAAFLRHADGRSRDEVLGYLRDVGGESASRAERRLDFIEHRSWRTYVFVYADGEALVRRWLDAVPGDRVARFGRLLRESWTPSMLQAEIGFT